MRRAELRVGGEAGERVGELLRRAGLDEDAVLAVADDVGDAADAGGDDRAAARERLDRRHRRALVRRGEHEDVERGEERADLLLVAGEQAVADDPELGGELLDPLAVGAVADHAERRASTPCSRSEREGAEDDVRALHARHPPRSSRRGTGRRRTPITRRVSARASARSATPALELDPEADDGELRRRRDAEGDELVAHLGADGDRARR